jgi:hypothetical protein
VAGKEGLSLGFKENVMNSLDVYRREELGISEAGVFRYKGRDLIKEHILPVNFKAHNIIENYRKSFYASSSSKIDFHRFYHHLNSSQALCINLFFPLMVENKLSLILDQLNIPKQAITEATFEKESDIESGSGRKTNFDFYLRLEDNTRVYFEIKYTESEFGKAKKDDEHRLKFTGTYLPLVKNNDYIKPAYKSVDSFLDSYQIMRNLCHIDEKSFVVFVYPKANKKIHSQAESVPDNILTELGQNKFRALVLETAIDELLRQVETEKLEDHYQEFKDKYLSHCAR